MLKVMVTVLVSCMHKSDMSSPENALQGCRDLGLKTQMLMLAVAASNAQGYDTEAVRPVEERCGRVAGCR